jgi:hypothetical protein
MVPSTFAKLAVLPPLAILLIGVAAITGPSGGSIASAPRGALDGLVAKGPAPGDTELHLEIELTPVDPELDSLAGAANDPASPQHRAILSRAAFETRFGRPQADIDRLTAYLRASGATGIYASSNRLVVGADLTVARAERSLGGHFLTYASGSRSAVAPAGTIRLPIPGIRAVRGTVLAYTPRLEDTPGLPTELRGEWYLPQRFREGYDAVPDGGAGMRIALIEDSSDRAARSDIERFISGPKLQTPPPGRPPGGRAGNPGVPEAGPAGQAFGRVPIEPIGADISHVIETYVSQPTNDERCSRDDRGQEPVTDIVAAIVLAPKVTIDVRYDDVCVAGGDGSLPLQRALDAPDAPDAIVMPIAAGPVYGPSAGTWGAVPIPYLEAALRGIPIVVAAGDDGAYGFRMPGIERPAVTYPCVLRYVICAGGSQLGQVNDDFDEGPWNDGSHATGGGISDDPRPPWQVEGEKFEFSPQEIKNRMVPDVAADAAGHLLAFWHGYGFGGVGGTSESASLIGGQIVAINAALPADKRLRGPGDLYALAGAHPEAFRDIHRANDRGISDNTIRARRMPLPLDYRGPVPTQPPTVRGCEKIQPNGCAVVKGYDAVTGIGSLKENAAIAALKQ